MRDRAMRRAELTTVLTISALAIGVIAIPQLNRAGDLAVDAWGLVQNAGKDIAQKIENWKGVEFSQPVREGDRVAGYLVTSGYGMRQHPVLGGERMHNGIDLATPEGTAVYAAALPGYGVDVKCRQPSETGGGGLVADVVSDMDRSLTIQYLHLSQCSAGRKTAGSIIARSGNTGTSTAPHLHVGLKRNGQYIQPTKGWVFWSITGRSPKDVSTLFAGGSNSPVAVAVGNAEGTRTPDGLFTPAFSGHVDPGNGVWNLGTFSYQHGASSPEDADRKQLTRLEKQARAAGLLQSGLTTAEKLNGIDLLNQAPLAGMDYPQRLKQCKAEGHRGDSAILCARQRSYYNPDGKLDAPGLGNDPERVRQDQQRRVKAVGKAVK
jgi:murein DD-endopeptidase MepM/ murein hydrolase activator NlpD